MRLRLHARTDGRKEGVWQPFTLKGARRVGPWHHSAFRTILPLTARYEAAATPGETS